MNRLTDAIAAYQVRRAAWQALMGTGYSSPGYHNVKAMPKVHFDAFAALTYARMNTPIEKYGMPSYGVNRSHACRICKRRSFAHHPAKILAHLFSVPHLAQEFKTSPFALANAVRGMKIMAGIDPDANKRRRKRRGKWNKNKAADKAARYAGLMLARWQKKLDQAKRKVKTWSRRMETAKAALEEKDTES